MDREEMVQALMALWKKGGSQEECGIRLDEKSLRATFSRTREYDDSECITHYTLQMDEDQLENLRSRIRAYYGRSIDDEEMEKIITDLVQESIRELNQEKDALSAVWGVIAFLIVLVIGFYITR